MKKELLPFEINSREEFCEFLIFLQKDFKKNQWENDSLQKFLSGLQSYAEDIDGFYKNLEPGKSAEKPTWKIFAEILKGASVYE